MNAKKRHILFLVLDAIFLSGAILAVLISCIQYDNWWPLVTVLVFALAIAFPTLCGGCRISNSGHDSWLDEDEGVHDMLAMLAWVLLGGFVVAGYAVPIELYLSSVMPLVGVYLTLAGGTGVLMATLIFVRLIYFDKDPDFAYLM